MVRQLFCLRISALASPPSITIASLWLNGRRKQRGSDKKIFLAQKREWGSLNRSLFFSGFLPHRSRI